MCGKKKGEIMKGFWKRFSIVLLVLVSGFAGFTIGDCIKNEITPIESWRSWLPAQEETVEENENLEDGELTLPGEDGELVE